jgi:Flp pilus assembly protein TadG
MSFCYVKSRRERTAQARLGRVFDFFLSQAVKVPRVGRVKQDRRGQALIEFVISFFVILLVGLASVDLSRGISTYQRMSSVGREAGRIFLKNNFDTKNFDATQLRPEVSSKVYTALQQAMLPDDLAADGTVIITVARRIINPSETESDDATDQLKITHQFVFVGTANDAPGGVSRIPDTDSDQIISGPPETTTSYPGFVPITTVRLDEELIIVEMLMKFNFYTPVDTLAGGISMDVLYDRAVF